MGLRHLPGHHTVLGGEGPRSAPRKRARALTHAAFAEALPLTRAQAKAYGPIVSGALFGAGWWFWVDAVTCSSVQIPFPQVGALHCLRRTAMTHEGY